MTSYKPRLSAKSIFDVVRTSPGRVDPRTGELVAYKSYKAVAPWELEERMRSRSDRGGRGEREFSVRPEGRMPWESRMAGPGSVGNFFGNAVPWVFLGIATIVALEASGVTNFSSPKKVG